MTFPAQDGPGRITSAARYVVSPDLIDFRVAFLRADADCQAISDAMPSGLAIARGAAETSEDMLGRLQRARTVRLEIVEAIHRHPWWSTVGNRFEAEQELRNAALEVMSPAPVARQREGQPGVDIDSFAVQRLISTARRGVFIWISLGKLGIFRESR